MTLYAIHPPRCGCDDCWPAKTAVPLDDASNSQIAAMLAGRLLNHTGEPITVTTTITATWQHLSWTVSTDSDTA